MISLLLLFSACIKDHIIIFATLQLIKEIKITNSKKSLYELRENFLNENIFVYTLTHHQIVGFAPLLETVVVSASVRSLPCEFYKVNFMNFEFE